jgi:hypothetical protein
MALRSSAITNAHTDFLHKLLLSQCGNGQNAYTGLTPLSFWARGEEPP